jgi:hypothetical protein
VSEVRVCPCGFDAAKFEPRLEKVDGAWRWHQEVCTIWLRSEIQRLQERCPYDRPGHALCDCARYELRRAEVAEAKLKRARALADEWLADQGDWLGRPRSWWDEKPYGEELAAALADA